MDGGPVERKTVVVADDTAFVRDRFRAALESAGHTAITVEGASELLDHVRTGPARLDLIVIDGRLSQIDGADLVRSIREVNGHVPVLVFSGTISNAGQVRKLAALGVVGYVNEYSAVPHIMPALTPHLFPDTFNRRTSPRVTLGIAVQYRVGGTIAAGVTLNVSHGGLAIRTTSPLEPGSKVKVRFRLPGSKHDIEAEGRVAWSDRRVGMGIQFEKVDSDHQTIVDAFVDAHFFTNRRA